MLVDFYCNTLQVLTKILLIKCRTFKTLDYGHAENGTSKDGNSEIRFIHRSMVIFLINAVAYLGRVKGGGVRDTRKIKLFSENFVKL